jgi:hypothetical protein
MASLSLIDICPSSPQIAPGHSSDSSSVSRPMKYSSCRRRQRFRRNECARHCVERIYEHTCSRARLTRSVALFRQALTGSDQDMVRWRTCVVYLNQVFGVVVGRMYVDRHFGQEARNNVSLPLLSFCPAFLVVNGFDFQFQLSSATYTYCRYSCWLLHARTFDFGIYLPWAANMNTLAFLTSACLHVCITWLTPCYVYCVKFLPRFQTQSLRSQLSCKRRQVLK